MLAEEADEQGSHPARNNRKRRESRVVELGRRWTEGREGKARRGEGCMSLAAASYAKVVKCTPRQNVSVLSALLSRLLVSVFWGLPLPRCPSLCSPTQGWGGRRDPPSPGQVHLQHAGQAASVEGGRQPMQRCW